MPLVFISFQSYNLISKGETEMKKRRKITCVDDRCFVHDYDAAKYVLEMASEHRRVKISHYDVG